MWKSKLLLLCCLLVLSFSVQPLFSDGVTLTDEEHKELLTLQETQEIALIEQAETISSLENELSQLKTESSAAKTLQEVQQTTIETLCLQIDALKKSLEGLNPDPEISVHAGGFYADDGPGVYAGVSYRF
ncbi:MAG: hypothetical protein PQJ59_01885 [Spirochaetales bacterium]|nr:hypothetical protein [Spirochaetales bacterium]